MKNRELAEIFEKLGDILEFKGENQFKVNAYRKAAMTLRDLTEDIEVIAAEGRLRKIPGIGEGIAKKIDEYLKTGKISKFEEEKKGVPDGIFDMLAIPGIGPKTVALVYKELGIETVEQLERAIDEGKLEKLFGMGAKKAENIKRGIQLWREGGQRINLGVAFPLVNEIIDLMKKSGLIKQISPAGSLRRMKETVGDIDILVTGKNGKKIIDYFVHLPLVKEILAAGDTKGSVRVEKNIQVDLRVVDEESYGAALQYFTGSKQHNIHLRDIAKREGLKINEYGVFKGDKKIAGVTEEEVYKTLDLPWIPPELREDRGEIEAAYSGSLPRLLEKNDIKGDLHVHSEWSDGSESLEELVDLARKYGYEYICIADHSTSLKVGHGLTPERLAEQIKQIAELNKRLKDVKLLAGVEVDIKADGELDFPDELLKQLDIVIAAIHSGFKKDAKTNTARLIKAMRNPYVTIIAHPTGRLIGERDPYAVNMDELLEEAAKTGTALEINAYYQRLDLNDIYCRRGKELGIKFAIGTDAHHGHQLWMMELGVGIARRGWLTKDDILNTMPYEKIKQFKKIIKH